MNLKYRKDIDGLRAIAVMAVILFHIEKSWLSGGFIGVDVFFVISGYLITGLLLKERSRTGRISLSEFYKKRIQRLLPVLLLVHFVVLLIAMLILMPPDLKDLVQGYIWSLSSLANFYFYNTADAGYFALESQTVPMLHLWSLSVEEQFYLVWPLLLGLPLLAKRKAVFVFILTVFLASLMFAQVAITKDRMFAHYMLPSRAWELAAGAICIFAIQYFRKLPHLVLEALSLGGLGLILWSCYNLSNKNAIPGFDALPAIFGVCMIICCGENSIVSRILSIKPIVAIGLISYSAYLWHWPIVAFAKYVFMDTTRYFGIPVIFGTLLLAALSYRWVEKPFRRKPLAFKGTFLRYMFGPYCALALCGLFVVSIEKHSTDPVDLIPAAAFKYKKNCQSSNFKSALIQNKRCYFPVRKEKPDLVLVGDSNAAHFVGFYHEIFRDFDISLLNVSQSSCPLIYPTPIDDSISVNKRYVKGCINYNATMSEFLRGFDDVIVGMSWTATERMVPDFRQKFMLTLEHLLDHNDRVILMGKIPVFSSYDSTCAYKSSKASFLNCESMFNSKYRRIPINEYLQSLAHKNKRVEYLAIDNQVCKNKVCSPYQQGKSLYYDGGHLSMKGSHLLGKQAAKRKDIQRIFDLQNLPAKPYQYEPKVGIERTKESIVFEVTPFSEKHSVAFYLYRGNERIDIQWYSADFDYELLIDDFSKGDYRVRYYVTEIEEPDKGSNEVWKKAAFSDWIKVP